MNRGRYSIYRHKKRIKDVFKRAEDDVDIDNTELRSDLAKYLCVLVSGFIEKSLVEIAIEHARRTGAPSLQRFVEKQTSRFTNANAEKTLQFLASFNQNWRDDFEKVFNDEYKDAFNSVVSIRHQIAHGSSVGITYHNIKNYFNAICKMIDYLQDLCIPDP